MPPLPEKSEARTVVEAQMRTPRRTEQRKLDPDEKAALRQRYLESLGKPVESSREYTRRD